MTLGFRLKTNSRPSRVGGNPDERPSSLDSRLRGNDGTSREGRSNVNVPSLRSSPFRLALCFEKMKIEFGKLKQHEVEGNSSPRLPAFPIGRFDVNQSRQMDLWCYPVPRTVRLWADRRAQLLFSECRRYNAQNPARHLALHKGLSLVHAASRVTAMLSRRLSVLRISIFKWECNTRDSGKRQQLR